MKKHIFLLQLLIALLCLNAKTLLAEDMGKLSGNVVVLESGVMMLGGHNIILWGIDPLANDQQCWQNKRAWPCGEQARLALNHYLENRLIQCNVKSKLSNIGGGKFSAQCFRTKDHKQADIARYLVHEGWARDNHDVSDGLYAPDEEDARLHRRGIWTSRFQTAQDWTDGIPRYVEYKQTPESVHKKVSLQ